MKRLSFRWLATRRFLAVCCLLAVTWMSLRWLGRDEITVRFVDEECRPLADKPLLLVEGLHSRFPLSGGSMLDTVRRTDDDGFARFDLQGRRTHTVKIYAYSEGLPHSEMPLLYELRERNEGTFIKDKLYQNYPDFKELRRTTWDRPLHIYLHPPLPKGMAESHDQDVIKLRFGNRIGRFMPGTFNSSPGDSVLFHWFLRAGEPYLQVYAVGQGGVREVDEAAFANHLPGPIGDKFIEYHVAPGRLTRSFHVTSDTGARQALVSIDLLYEATEKLAYASVFTHSLQAGDRQRIPEADTLMRRQLSAERCGGALSTAPGGYFATLSDESLTALRDSRQILGPEDENGASAIAANPDTPLAWYRVQLHEETELKSARVRGLMEAALDNNGAITERIRFLYGVATTKADWGLLIHKIAEDERTPVDILEHIVDSVHGLTSFSVDRLVPVAKNPNATTAILAKIVDLVADKPQGRNLALLEAVAVHPNASEALIHRILDLCPVTDRGRIMDVVQQRRQKDAQTTPIGELETLKSQSPNLHSLLVQLEAYGMPPTGSLDTQVRLLYASRKQVHLRDEDFLIYQGTPGDILEEIFQRTEDGDAILSLANNPATPMRILRRIADGDYLVTESFPNESWLSLGLFCNPTVDYGIRAYLPREAIERCPDARWVVRVTPRPEVTLSRTEFAVPSAPLPTKVGGSDVGGVNSAGHPSP